LDEGSFVHASSLAPLNASFARATVALEGLDGLCLSYALSAASSVSVVPTLKLKLHLLQTVPCVPKFERP